MPKLIGTRHNDSLIAQDARDWVIRGRAGNDYLEGNDGFDRLYGGDGNDDLQAWGSTVDVLYGNQGNDILNGGAERRGGDGDDWLSGTGLSGGGAGNDHIAGRGFMFGSLGDDQIEFSPEYGVANDSYLTGGLGADRFLAVGLVQDGALQHVEIMDFTPGVDKVGIDEAWDDGRWDGLDPLQATFQHLDANHNGVLEWSDSIGPDGDWNTLDGSAVYTDGHSMYIGLGATFAGPSSNDATDWVTIHGTSQITLADWLTL